MDQLLARLRPQPYAISGPQLHIDAHQQSHWTYQATFSSVINNKIPDYFLCLLKNKGYDLPSG